MILPKALYGSELWTNLSETSKTVLERSHCLCLKTLQNIDRRTKNSIALSLVGSTNLQCEIEKRKAVVQTRYTFCCEAGIFTEIFKLPNSFSNYLSLDLLGMLSRFLKT